MICTVHLTAARDGGEGGRWASSVCDLHREGRLGRHSEREPDRVDGLWLGACLRCLPREEAMVFDGHWLAGSGASGVRCSVYVPIECRTEDHACSTEIRATVLHFRLR